MAGALAGAVASAVALALALAGTARDRGEGPREAGSSVDLGDQADPVALGRAVDAALRLAPPPVPEEAAHTCAAETRATYGQGLWPLVYTARARWKEVPAAVLTFRVDGAAGAGLDHRLFVVSTAGCHLLVAQSL